MFGIFALIPNPSSSSSESVHMVLVLVRDLCVGGLLWADPTGSDVNRRVRVASKAKKKKGKKKTSVVSFKQ